MPVTMCSDDYAFLGHRPDEIDQEIGVRLHVARRSRGRSRAWLAEQLGVTEDEVALAEHGKAGLGVSFVYAAARAIGIPASDLMPTQGLEDEIGAGVVAEFLTSAAGLEIAELASQLSDLSRARLLTLVEVMVSQERPAAA